MDFFPCTYGFETGLFPNILFDSTFRFKGIQISDQNSFNFLLPIKSKYLCKTKPQINSGLLVRLMNHNESFYELSLNFKHVIKHKSVSKNHFEYIPVYLVIFFFFFGSLVLGHLQASQLTEMLLSNPTCRLSIKVLVYELQRHAPNGRFLVIR